jgi:hypothetical protein
MARGWVSFWTDIDGVVILILFLDMLLIDHIRGGGGFIGFMLTRWARLDTQGMKSPIKGVNISGQDIVQIN